MKYSTIASDESLIKQFSFLKAVTIVLMMGGIVSCSPETTDEIEADITAVVNNDVHVAFAGGGWRAHTGHAAWVMSLLASNNTAGGCDLSDLSGNPTCLADAFTNVKTVSGNSGGSWFSTMLMYDTTFVNQITGSKAVQNWGAFSSKNPNQGWLGKQENYWATFSAKCGSDTAATYLECVLDHYFSPQCCAPFHPQTPNWSQFVQDLVYKGYDWQSYGNLSSNTRQAWAKDKSLLMAGTWLTNSVLLNHNSDETYYQVCLTPAVDSMSGDDGSWCLDRSNGQKVSMPDVLPVTFSSLAENEPGLRAPSFISTRSNTFNLGYSGAYAFSTTPSKKNTLQSGNIKTDSIPVMWAAAASSAAGGYAASYTVADPHLPSSCDISQWDCIYHARNMALGFKVPDGKNQVAFVSDKTLDGISLDDLSTDRLMRIADGGAIDNSGIAQLIGYLQLNKLDTNFNIVAFDDVQINDASDKTKYPSSDISYMFDGAPSDQVCVDKVCVGVPGLVIVAPDSASSNPITKHTWMVIDASGSTTGDFLHYYIYEVETLKNDTFNINGSSKGTIHVFASEFGCAGTAPENQNDFSCYGEMVQSFGPTLKRKPINNTSSKTGLVLLKEAFGL